MIKQRLQNAGRMLSEISCECWAHLAYGIGNLLTSMHNVPNVRIQHHKSIVRLTWREDRLQILGCHFAWIFALSSRPTTVEHDQSAYRSLASLHRTQGEDDPQYFLSANVIRTADVQEARTGIQYWLYHHIVCSFLSCPLAFPALNTHLSGVENLLYPESGYKFPVFFNVRWQHVVVLLTRMYHCLPAALRVFKVL